MGENAALEQLRINDIQAGMFCSTMAQRSRSEMYIQPTDDLVDSGGLM